MPADSGPEAVDWDEWFEALLVEGLSAATEGMTEEQIRVLLDVMLKTSDGTAEILVAELRKGAPEMLSQRRAFDSEVSLALREDWGKAFDLTEMVIKSAVEVAEFFYDKHVPPDGVHAYAFEALARLAARACRLAEEILVLMKAGYGQGAMSRWRALHEVAVVATFIQVNGDVCAERYFKHEAVESWRAAEEFQRHASTLGQEPNTVHQMAALKAEFDAVVLEYGTPFTGHYGWAYDDLRKSDPKADVNFPAIEASAGLAHMRPDYRLASHPNHAKAKGITFDPDLPRAQRGAVLLTGPGPAGLADPGNLAVISLTQVIAAFLDSNPGTASVLLMSVLLKLADLAGEAYAAAHEEVERDTSGE
jgi:hypothetical protein